MEESMNRYQKETTTVVEQREISEGIFDLRLKTKSALNCRPGQFAGIYPPSDAHMLMRPISICECDKDREEIRFVYRIAGEGTGRISGVKSGDVLELLSVLGNGFPLEEAKGKKLAIMGGGIGIPPMLYTAREVLGMAGETEIYLGYRNGDTFLAGEFEDYGNVNIVTEDGSKGYKGNVLDAIKERAFAPEVIFACGPMPMLRAVKRFAGEIGAKAFISLEERMACGVGACLGCVVQTKDTDRHSHVKNARICTEGPVFDAKEVEI